MGSLSLEGRSAADHLANFIWVYSSCVFLFVCSCNSRACMRNMADIDGVSFGLYRYKCTNWRGSGCQAGKWIIQLCFQSYLLGNLEILSFLLCALKNCEILRSRLKTNFFLKQKLSSNFLSFDIDFWHLKTFVVNTKLSNMPETLTNTLASRVLLSPEFKGRMKVFFFFIAYQISSP